MRASLARSSSSVSFPLGVAREHYYYSAVKWDMKTFLVSLLGILLACCLTGPSRAGSEPDKELTKQVADILTECKKITPGATRAELLKVFTTEGGISTATRRTFAHRRCPYIKVDVEFTPSESKQKPLEERPTDTISKISRPYLEWSIGD